MGSNTNILMFISHTKTTEHWRALEVNELIKCKVYHQAFVNFANEAEDPTNSYHQTYQNMRRINLHTWGEPKITPSGVNIYGILSKDAHNMLVRLSEIRFPRTENCLSYLSACQQWIDWWI